MRSLTHDDCGAYAQMLHRAFNTWYAAHGWPADYFRCAPGETGIFYDIYADISPGASIAAFDPRSGAIMGACFYHPREHHVSLGIMSVNPDYFRRGVGRALVKHIVDFTEVNRHPALRLVSSAMNMDSFSLYTRSGFVPHGAYHDMVIPVPAAGLNVHYPLRDRVRAATPGDVPAMTALEMNISGITRNGDYRYAIENPRGVLHALVSEDEHGHVDGFMISVRHAALNMLGPCVARTEETTLALLLQASERFRGEIPLCIIPMDKRVLVETLYAWGARNVETHLCQVRGRFQPFEGVSLPSFLPETG